MQIFSKVCLRQNDEWTNRYKTRDVVNTYLTVTFEDLFLNAPTLAKIEFGNEQLNLVTKLGMLVHHQYVEC